MIFNHMRAEFPEFFPLEERDFQDLWDRGLVVLDTNILLRLYRYSETTVDEILGVLSGFGDRLWIPHHVAWEYNRRRLTKIKEAERSYRELLSEFQRAAEGGRTRLQAMREFGIHPKIDLSEKITGLISDIEQQTTSISQEYDASPTGSHYAALHDRVASIYEGRVGTSPSLEDIRVMCSDGQLRFEQGRAPGFKDVEEKRKRGASDRESFGDYIIWRQILNHASSNGFPVIFVTEDAKEDWWLREDGKTIGPLPELRQEFISETRSQVHFYRIQTFLEQSKIRLQASVSDTSVEDVIESSNAPPKWDDVTWDELSWSSSDQRLASDAHLDFIDERMRSVGRGVHIRGPLDLRVPEGISEQVQLAEIGMVEARRELELARRRYERSLRRDSASPASNDYTRQLRRLLEDRMQMARRRELEFQAVKARAIHWYDRAEDADPSDND